MDATETGDLEALSSFDYRQRQDKILGDYLPLWPWLFEAEQYVNWCKGRPWTLRCYGEPECGKTFLAAAVARDLQAAHNDGHTAVFLLLLGEPDSRNQTIYSVADPVETLWRTVLRQLHEILRDFHLLEDVSNASDMQSLSLEDLTVETLQSRVNALIRRHFDRVFVIVDDLDRCPPDVQTGFTDVLTNLPTTKQGIGRTCVFATGKLHSRIVTRNVNCNVKSCRKPKLPVLYWRCCECLEDEGVEFDVCQQCYDDGFRCGKPRHHLAEPYKEVMVQLKTDQAGMLKFVRNKLEDASRGSKLEERVQKAQQLKDAIERSTINTASGSLVIAKSYIDHLFKFGDFDELLNVLNRVASPEQKYYHSLMQIIMYQPYEDRNIALQTLYLVSYVHETNSRRLSYEEVSDVISIANSESGHELRPLTLDYLLEVCRGALTVLPGDHDLLKTFHDNMSLFLHQEDHEYFDEIDFDATEVCLDVLADNHELGSIDSVDSHQLQNLLQQHPFLVYASQCWGSHLLDNPSKTLSLRASDLLKNERRLFASLYIACVSPINAGTAFDIWPGSHALHVYAFFGLSEQLESMITADNTVMNVRELVHERTPLSVACQNGQHAIVRSLLSKGAQRDLLSRDGHSALCEAVERGQANIVQLFIDFECWTALNANQGLAQQGTTPLIGAVVSGRNEDLCRMLADHKMVNINAQDANGKTALMHAISRMNFRTAEILLQREDIDLGLQDRSKDTALHIATTKSDSKILKRLIDFARSDDRKISLTVQDARGRTPLMALVELTAYRLDAVYVDVIRDLIGVSDQSNLTDHIGRNLVHYACMSDSQLPVLKLLVSAGILAFLADESGWTPLHLACARGASGIADYLIELGGTVTATSTTSGLYPSDAAKLYGYEHLAQRVQHWERTSLGNQRSIDLTQSKPLWYRIQKGDNSDAEALPTISMNDVLSIDPLLGHTALHKAVLKNGIRMVEWLLKDGRVGVNAKSRSHETALRLAVKFNDRSQIVHALLHAGADVGIADLAGVKPLEYARQANPRSTITLLLVQFNDGPIPVGPDLQPMLSAAIRAENREAISKLLQSGASILCHDERGLLPVHIATEVDNESFVQWIQDHHVEAMRAIEASYFKSPS